MPELTVHGVTKRFGDVTVLEEISFTVADGEFFTLLGPSGCGKSTTLAMIAGLERPDAGSITVGDTVFVDAGSRRFVEPEQRNLGMVFQSYALWPHMTVAANLALALKLRKVSRAEQNERIDRTLEQVGLLEYRERYPHQLSGGQQQRVALARALVYSPSVLLLDEPLSNLDAKLRERARAWLKELQEEVGVTAVYVTHDQTEALALSDRIAVMNAGRMVQVGTPREIYETPASAQVADFVGRCNFLPARIAASDATSATLDLDGAERQVRVRDTQRLAAGTEVTLGVRAERLRVSASQPGDGVNAVPARLRKVMYVGSRFEYEVEAGGRVLFAESTERLIDDGTADAVWVGVPDDGAFVFAERYPPAGATDADAELAPAAVTA